MHTEVLGKMWENVLWFLHPKKMDKYDKDEDTTKQNKYKN